MNRAMKRPLRELLKIYAERVKKDKNTKAKKTGRSEKWKIRNGNF